MRLVPVLALTGLLAGCGALENFNSDVNEVGRQIVAGWEGRPDVAAAQFEYRHGLDAGESLTVEALVHADRITATTVDELVELAERTSWRGTWRDVRISYAVYSTDDPPFDDEPDQVKPVREGVLEFDAGAAASYGPRPTRPGK